jgi:hypothetical protein
MHPDLHRYLDGELSREDLSPDAQRELLEWEALERPASLLSAMHAPADFEWRVMNALPRVRTPAWKRAIDWVTLPQTFTLRPVTAFAAAAMLVLGITVPKPWQTQASDTARVAGVETDDPNATVYVQFVLASADAKTVSVAGDFNQWQQDAGALQDTDGDGVWTGLVAVQPGLHKYMFVVNGEEWVTDPRAEHYIDDGFGMRNALIAVAAPRAERRT